MADPSKENPLEPDGENINGDNGEPTKPTAEEANVPSPESADQGDDGSLDLSPTPDDFLEVDDEGEADARSSDDSASMGMTIGDILERQMREGSESDRDDADHLTPPTPEKPAFKPALGVGDQIGFYKIERFISRAGIGETYLVEHTLKNKLFVLKVLPRVLARSQDFLERFEKSSLIFKGLAHPNIALVQGVVKDKGFYCLVLEYVAGPSGRSLNLEMELDRRGNLPEKEAKRITLQICNALIFAQNRKQLAHSDLKPSNILFNSERDVKITNFGLVRLIGHDFFRHLIKLTINQCLKNRMTHERAEQDNEEKIDKTASFVLLTPEEQARYLDFGQFKMLGGGYLRNLKSGSAATRFPELKTPPSPSDHDTLEEFGTDDPDSTHSIFLTYDYMSPEQKTGKEPTARSNIYSLGLLLYRMLTGRKMVGNWELPSHFGCNPLWDKIIVKCLRTAPEERYDSIEKLRADVAKVKSPWMKVLFYGSAAMVVATVVITSLVVFLSDKIVNKYSDPLRLFKLTTPTTPKPQVQPEIEKIVVQCSTTPANASVSVFDANGKLVLEKTIANDGTTFELPVGRYRLHFHKPTFASVDQHLDLSGDDTAVNVRLVKTPNSSPIEPFVKPMNGSPFVIPDMKFEFAAIPPGPLKVKGENSHGEIETKIFFIERPFWIAKHEVTQSQYEKIMWKNPGYFLLYGGDAPVESVNWNDAMAFCQRLNEREAKLGRLPEGYQYRLPDELEWEYACRAGTNSTYFFGNDLEALDSHVWYVENSVKRTQPVGKKTPNAWGVADMLGNVQEWCLTVKSSPIAAAFGGNKTGWNYVLRGGSWNDPPSELTVEKRNLVDSPLLKNTVTGFRVTLAPIKETESPHKNGSNGE